MVGFSLLKTRKWNHIVLYVQNVYSRKDATCMDEFFPGRWTNTSHRNLNYSTKYSTDPSSVIVMLVDNKRLLEFLPNLCLLFEHFNNQFLYPIVLFHFGDLDAAEVYRELDANYFSPQQMGLIEILQAEYATQFPDGFDGSKERASRENFPDLFRYPNYHHMCAFWFRIVFLQSYFERRNIEYFLRFDTDSTIESPIQYDLFKFMKRNNLAYAYRVVMPESPCCVKNLSLALQKYVQMENISRWNILSRLDLNSEDMLQYYNNMEIVHISSFRDDPRVWHWINYIWATGGIYQHRYLTVLSMPLDEILWCYLLVTISGKHRGADTAELAKLEL